VESEERQQLLSFRLFGQARSAARRVAERAERDALQLVTTEKDAARLQGDPAVAALAARAMPFPVALAIDEEDRFRRFLRERTGLPV